jgi:hypothetical protein
MTEMVPKKKLNEAIQTLAATKKRVAETERKIARLDKRRAARPVATSEELAEDETAREAQREALEDMRERLEDATARGQRGSLKAYLSELGVCSPSVAKMVPPEYQDFDDDMELTPGGKALVSEWSTTHEAAPLFGPAKAQGGRTLPPISFAEYQARIRNPALSPGEKQAVHAQYLAGKQGQPYQEKVHGSDRDRLVAKVRDKTLSHEARQSALTALNALMKRRN